jgi:hypothetical protein
MVFYLKIATATCEQSVATLLPSAVKTLKVEAVGAVTYGAIEKISLLPFPAVTEYAKFASGIATVKLGV